MALDPQPIVTRRPILSSVDMASVRVTVNGHLVIALRGELSRVFRRQLYSAGQFSTCPSSTGTAVDSNVIGSCRSHFDLMAELRQ